MNYEFYKVYRRDDGKFLIYEEVSELLVGVIGNESIANLVCDALNESSYDFTKMH